MRCAYGPCAHAAFVPLRSASVLRPGRGIGVSAALLALHDRALIVGGGALAGLGYGCVQVVRETGLAVQNLTEEARL